MNAGFTPGPWVRTIEHDLSLYGELVEDDRSTSVTGSVVLANPEVREMAVIVADINSPNTWDDDLLEANARLIAAGPDLYEALEQISAEYENANLSHHDFRVGARLIADAALSKARGEQP